MSKSFLIAFLFCATIVWINTFHLKNVKNVKNIKSKKIDFSYYDLALQRCQRGVNFSIHGLWPEYNVHTWPQFCNKTEYHEFNKKIFP